MVADAGTAAAWGSSWPGGARSGREPLGLGAAGLQRVPLWFLQLCTPGLALCCLCSGRGTLSKGLTFAGLQRCLCSRANAPVAGRWTSKVPVMVLGVSERDRTSRYFDRERALTSRL